MKSHRIIYENTNFDIKSEKRKTTIRKVNENNIEQNIDRIKTFNKNISIYKIIYNKKKQELIIIADKKIQIHRNLKKRFIAFNSTNDLKKELEKLLNQDKIVDEEYISLEQIKIYYKKIIDTLYEQKNNIEEDINEKLKSIYGKTSELVIYNYDSINNTIKIGFNKNYQERKYKTITIGIKNNDIVVIKSEYKDSENIIKLLKQDLIELFNNYKRYKYFDEFYNEDITKNNANFHVNLTLYGITLSSKYSDNLTFKIKYSTYEDKFYIYSDNDIKPFLQHIAPLLLEKIYIPINECPTWSQEYFFNIREQELNPPKQKRYRKS